MKNNDRNTWYAPLSAQFQLIEEAMPLSRFAAIEAVLYLLSLTAPDADPAKAYLLFTQYQLIGTTHCSDLEHTLQQARFKLGYYRSQKYWQDDLREYRKKRYDAVRAFSIQQVDEKRSLSKAIGPYPYPYEERAKEWVRFWPERVEDLKAPTYAETGTYRYQYSLESGDSETVRVKLNCAGVDTAWSDPVEKSCRHPITISIKELLSTAEKMAEICPGDPCFTILKTNILKEVNGSTVQPCSELTIREVVNMVGMVGAGKSTLIKVLSFWFHQHGLRMAVVVDTVAETLSLQKYLSSLGVAASPLIGRSERMKYINQVSQPDEICLSASYSQYLTPACLIDGMDEQHDAAIVFGKEPCYSLKKGNQHYLCPYFEQCSGTKMFRDCYTASVVVTTVAGFAASRVGTARETFLELAMRDFDLVVFDESDRVQKTLDHFFMPETSFNNYIRECAEDCSAYMKLSSKHREENLAAQRYDEMQRQSVTVLSCIVKSLHHELGAWRKITYGDPFSALTLLDDLYQTETEFKIPHTVYQAIYNLIDMQDEERIRQSTLWAVLDSSCKSTDEFFFDRMYQLWLTELGETFPRPEKNKVRKIQDARIKLILRLIYFDHFIRGLSDAYEASHETSYGQNELFGFLQTRFRQQQHFLPSALCGNLFGLKKTDEEDIILFRQFAFGRSLMKDLPYLRTDQHGNPAGPHVILLSGSSWAEGSYEYHVNRPVNYILEADAEKRMFLEKTRFFESGFLERISGAGDDQRMAQLRSVTQKAVDLIVREYERKAGKILLVVNSYAQALEVQQTLETALRKANCSARTCRMIADAINAPSGEDTVRRGEVSRFAQMNADILIAPAMAIERGHNIVDEYGHSALSAVFFMVRPMAVPDDIQQKGSKLNGLVESHCKREAQESLFAYDARIRQFAAWQWNKMCKTKAFGIAELSEDERKDVVATLFVLILQIFGRLARVTDISRPAPHVYFIDGAFRRRPEKVEDFDCLSELGQYLEKLMTQKESAEIAKTLYAPFYQAYRKDISYEQ
ncbi:pPIWI_RE_Z domain-containing protein [Dysosmobacter sp. Phy]